MKFKFIANACGIFTSGSGKTILCDPWIEDGVFDGSWCHFHKLETKIEDLKNVDALYISHVHPDHFDTRNFDYRKDIPIFVLDHGFNFLHKNLNSMGYNNLIKVKNGETIKYEDFRVTLYAPFAKHNFFEDVAAVGNLIDSAIVIEADGVTAFNANDNTPTIKACEMIKNKFGKIDLALMNYNAAGPYPSCFNNLSETEKFIEHKNVLNKNFDYLLNNLEVLDSKMYLPFAGAYVIGGKLSHKNKYLGTTNWDECAEYIKMNIKNETEVICLRENDEIDLTTGKKNNQYIPIDTKEMKRYINEELSKIKYDYENDEEVNAQELKNDLIVSSKKMLERCSKISLVPDMDVYIDINDEQINICKAENSKGSLYCSLDLRLLKRILNKNSHWNNAEIGCHIDFVRSPNYYSPDMHTMLQFLHL